MKKVLLISPYFPPNGVIGSKRPLHLARNLPAHSWQPVILAAPPEGAPRDESLSRAIPTDAIVSYEYCSALRHLQWRSAAITKNKDEDPNSPTDASLFRQRLKFLTPFDRYLWDTPAAIRAGMRLIHTHQPVAIHVIADPWSGLITALRLHRRSRLPLVVDLRDPWSVHESKMALRPAISRWYLRHFEKSLFSAAGKIVLNTNLSREAYQRSYAGVIPTDRFTTVRNAFDPGLFSCAPTLCNKTFTAIYFGTFRLFVGPEQILEGFSRFINRKQLGPAEAQLHFVGKFRHQDQVLAERLGLTNHIIATPAVAFAEGMNVLRNAGSLVLTIEPSCQLQIPGKFYDYLAAGRPILAISDNPEVNSLIDQTGAGMHVPYSDSEAISNAFSQLYQAHRQQHSSSLFPDVLQQFSALEQARRFAEIYQQVIRS